MRKEQSRRIDARLSCHYPFSAVEFVRNVTTRTKGERMQVQDGMSRVVLSVGPGHTLRDAARLMAGKGVGAAVVMDSDAAGPGILTERDVLLSIGAGQDPDTEKVADHLTTDVVFAAPDWSLERAASEMVRGGFRHLIVCSAGDVEGILSVRDVVRVWTQDGATSTPEGAGV